MRNINELNKKVEELKEIKKMIEELEAEADAIKDAIKEEMAEAGVEELQGDTWKATWHMVTSARLDTKRLKAEAPETYAKYAKETKTCRFTIN